jgi:Ca2+-transporting ATPase
MNRPPRRKAEGLFTRRTLVLSLLQGFVVLAIVFLVYWIALFQGMGEEKVRTLTFATIVVANLCLILTNRSWSDTIITSLRTPNRALAWVFGGTIICLLLVLYVPVLQDVFRFGTISPAELLACIFAGGISVLWFEGYKILLKNTELNAPGTGGND